MAMREHVNVYIYMNTRKHANIIKNGMCTFPYNNFYTLKKLNISSGFFGSQANTRQIPGKYQANTRQIPGKYQANTRQIPGKYQANTRQIPGKYQANGICLQFDTFMLSRYTAGTCHYFSKPLAPEHIYIYIYIYIYHNI
jgi:hypothetical protein